MAEEPSKLTALEEAVRGLRPADFSGWAKAVLQIEEITGRGLQFEVDFKPRSMNTRLNLLEARHVLAEAGLVFGVLYVSREDWKSCMKSASPAFKAELGGLLIRHCDNLDPQKGLVGPRGPGPPIRLKRELLPRPI